MFILRLVRVLLVPVAMGLVLAQVELEPRVFEIASKLRCPVCISESVAQSAAPTSVQMREIIAEKIAAGESEREILAYFQARYGDWILLEPPRRGIFLLVWLLPVFVTLVIAAGVAFLVMRWSRRGNAPVQADPAYLERVRRESLDEGTP